MEFRVTGVIYDAESDTLRNVVVPVADCADELDAIWQFMEMADAEGLEVVGITHVEYPQASLFN